MKTLIVLLLLAYSPKVFNPSAFRQLFAEAATEEGKAEMLMRESKKHMPENYVATGYYGAAKMLIAKYYFNPYSKLKTFSEGKETLEAVLCTHPGDVELRYLRLTIQSNTPAFLGYKSEMKADREFLADSLAGLKDEELKTIIVNYLENHVQ